MTASRRERARSDTRRPRPPAASPPAQPSSTAPLPPSVPTRRPGPSAALAAGALGALVVVAYAPAFRAGFIWDDDAYVTRNATLRTASGLARIWLVPGSVPQYYPLTFTSFWLEHQVFGDAATGYHVTNVLLHALNALLVWRVLSRLAVPGAWLAAAVFAVHPVQVESVAWITERKNVLSGACYLGALLLALRVAGFGARASRRRDAVALAALFAAALLAKTVTCTLPVTILVILWWRRGTIDRRAVVATLPLFALGGALALVTVWVERTHVGARGALFDLGPLDRMLIAGRALWFYVATLAWPHPLSFVYPRWTIDPAAWWQWLFPLAGVATFAALWIARDRIGRAPFAAALGFAATLAPALGVVDVYPMRYTFVADHYQYLASLFVLVPVAALLASAAPRLGAGAPALAGALLALLAGLTWQRTLVYADEETLWRDVIAENPSGSMAYVNLGMWLHQRGRSEEALAALGEARRLEPADAEVEGDLGVVLAALGRPTDAVAHLEAAVRLAPRSALARSNLGNGLAAAGRPSDAEAQYREAVRLAPGYADAHNNLANVLVQQGRTEEAREHYRAAIAADPGYVDAHYNLAVVAARAGASDEAVAEFAATVALSPGHAEAQRGLGAALAARGDVAGALPHLAEAARLEPHRAEAQYQLGAALAAAGRTADAIAAYQRAVALRPDFADAHNDLGIALAARGDRAGAVREFREAVRLAPDHAEAHDNLAAALRADPDAGR